MIQVADWSNWGNVRGPMQIQILQVAKLIVLYFFVKISTLISKIMNSTFILMYKTLHCDPHFNFSMEMKKGPTIL